MQRTNYMQREINYPKYLSSCCFNIVLKLTTDGRFCIAGDTGDSIILTQEITICSKCRKTCKTHKIIKEEIYNGELSTNTQ